VGAERVGAALAEVPVDLQAVGVRRVDGLDEVPHPQQPPVAARFEEREDLAVAALHDRRVHRAMLDGRGAEGHLVAARVEDLPGAAGLGPLLGPPGLQVAGLAGTRHRHRHGDVPGGEVE
jgi:hypothetical protein